MESQFTVTALIYDLAHFHAAIRNGHRDDVVHEWRLTVQRSASNVRARVLAHAAFLLRHELPTVGRALRRAAHGRDRKSHNTRRVRVA